MMDVMPSMNRSTRRSGSRHAVAATATIVLLVTSACGGSDDEAEAAVETVAATTQAPAATTTTVESPTTTELAATTTSEPTVSTIGVQESEPIAPPADEYGTEPVIEMGTLSIPSLDVSMTMYEGIRLTTLDFGPGHWPGSAVPGQNGNVVVAGHRTSKHKVFRDVDQLVEGDEIVFEDDNGRHVYEVTRIEIVEPDALWIVDPTDTPTVTLFACHPPGSTAQRIVVFGDLDSGSLVSS